MRIAKAAGIVALGCVATAVALSGCSPSEADGADAGTPAKSAAKPAGAEKITIDGQSVNVSCAGTSDAGEPVVLLLAGLGDDLTKFADIQKTLSEDRKVCSFDRLGQGASDKPKGPQDFAAVDKVVTGVIDHVAADNPVVLVGHSFGGLITGRYAPDHTDKVKGVMLLDATSPTVVADTQAVIPESAEGPAAQLRQQIVAVAEGQNPEMLATPDGAVKSAGDIPVRVIQHGKPYLEQATPEYGKQLEKAWQAGQKKWLKLSGNSTLRTAENSAHHIYLDEPELVVEAIEDLVEEVDEKVAE